MALRCMYHMCQAVHCRQQLSGGPLALHVPQLCSLRASNAVAGRRTGQSCEPCWLPCRPAATEALDSSMPTIGCPAYVPMASKDAPSGVGLFFVSVQGTMRGNSARSQVGSSACCEYS